MICVDCGEEFSNLLTNYRICDSCLVVREQKYCEHKGLDDHNCCLYCGKDLTEHLQAAAEARMEER